MPHNRRSFFDDTVPVLRTSAAASLWIALTVGSAMASSQPEKPPGPVVMVHFDYYPKDISRIHALERQLARVIKKAHAGALGETEFHVDGNDGYLYMFGPDSDRLYAVTGPTLRSSRLMLGAEVTKWHGARTETFVMQRDGKR